MFKDCGFVNIDYLVENKLERNPSKMLNIINRDWRKWVKPVCMKPTLKSLDPLDPNFGYETLGGSAKAPGAGYMYGSVFTAPSDVSTALSITIGCDQTDAYHFKGVIVLHSNLNIITNGVGGAIAMPKTKNWSPASSFSTPPTLTPSTDYVLMAVFETSPTDFYYNTGDANQGHLDYSNSYASPANPTDATHSTNKFSIYCTYTVAPPAGGVLVQVM